MKTYGIRLATVGDANAIIGLIDDAAQWLRDKKTTDQWARPWPSRDERDGRILKGIEREATWIVENGSTPIATMSTYDEANPEVWPEAQLVEPAIYVHRLVVSHHYRGLNLGGQLIDWAGERGLWRAARWIRVDVWTTNTDLHRYYEAQGFLRSGTCADPRYPSGALFQKPIDQKAIDSTSTSPLLPPSRQVATA